MKNSILKGFSVVFKHNLKIHMKNAKYVASTIVIALVLLLGMGALVFFVTKSDAEKDKYDFKVDKVYVVDETGLGVADYSMFGIAAGFDYIKDTEFIASEKKADELIEDEAVSYMLVQTKNELDDIYEIQIITGKEVDSKDKQVKKNLECLEELVELVFKNHVYLTSGLTVEQVIQVIIPVKGEAEEIGSLSSDEEDDKLIVAVIVTAILLFVVYFVVLIYGAGICADVPMEKTSKLVEQLLMAVSPYALVSGKILSMIASCLIQFVIWIICLISGIFLGDAVVKSVYDLDTSFVSTAMDNLGKWFVGNGFTVSGVIMAILLFMVGLVVYLLLAGLGGATLSKPENAANVQSIFVLPLIISYFAILGCSGIASGNYDMPMVFNFIPYTSAMTAPACVLLGSMSMPVAFASLAVSIIVCGVELIIAAKVYEGLLFFNGNKLKFKDIVKIFKK